MVVSQPGQPSGRGSSQRGHSACAPSRLFFTAEFDANQVRHGRLVQFDDTTKMFTNPVDQRTEDYITGRFG